MKAIDRAKTDRCDLVNMSLGESGLDEGIVSSIKDAYNEGLICVVAMETMTGDRLVFPHLIAFASQSRLWVERVAFRLKQCSQVLLRHRMGRIKIISSPIFQYRV